MAVFIGEKIHEWVHKKGLKAKTVANFVNVSESSLYKIYKRESIDIDKMIKFSELLGVNLFLYYLNEEPLKSMFSKQTLTFQQRIAELEAELAVRNQRLNDLAETIEAQRKIISLHEAGASKGKRKS